MIIAAAMLSCLGGSAAAGERENAMSHIAQVSAAQALCSKVEVAQGKVAAIALLYGVDIERDKAELMLQARSHMAAFKGMDEDMACVAGMALYGPEGSSVPGLLNWK